MVFLRSVSGLVRQSILSNTKLASTRQVRTNILNATRCFSSSRLFVGGLRYETDNKTLREAFSGFGDVVSANVVMNRETGKSKGFGFVEFESSEDAAAALSSMDGQEINGRPMRVSYADKDTKRSPPPSVSYGNKDSKRPARSRGGGGGGGADY